MQMYLCPRLRKSKRAALFALIMLLAGNCLAQRKKTSQPATKTPPAQSVNELSKLHDEYIKATREYKASLQKLLALYQDAVKKAEAKRDQALKLFAEGLMAKREVEQAEATVTSANLKVTEVQTQISGADTQIAQALVEVEGEKQIARLGPIRRGDRKSVV